MIAIIVAHPDDELLWFRTSIRYWKVRGEVITAFCVTNGYNSIRNQEFAKSCDLLGIKGVIANLRDNGGDILLKDLNRTLAEFLYKYQPALVVTHPPHGNEREHLHHQQIFYSLFFIRKNFNFKFAFTSEIIYSKPEINTEWLLNSRYFLRLRKKALREHFSYFLFLIFNKFICFYKEKAFFLQTELEDKYSKVEELKIYPSQYQGLLEYQTSYSQKEYLYQEID